MHPVRLRSILLCLCLVLGASGCALTFDAHTLGAGVTMATPGQLQPAGTEFRVSRKAVYLLWGAVPAGQPSLQRALAGQLGNGASIANLRIKVRSRFSDLLLTALTGGLIVPRSVTYEGVIVPAPSPTPGQ